jgi:hypothetical protein
LLTFATLTVITCVLVLQIIMLDIWLTPPWTTLEEGYIAFCYRPQNVPIVLNKF